MDKVLLPVLFFAISIGLFFSFIRPTYDALSALKAQEARLDRTLTSSEDLKQKVDKLIQTFNAFDQNDIMRLDRMLPKKIDVVRAIIQIDSLVRKNGLELKGFKLPDMKTVPISPDDGKNVLSVKKAAFTIECSGSYQDVKALLTDFERSLTLMDVTSFTVSVTSDTQKNSKVVKEVNSLFPSYTITVELPYTGE